jgi:hypothetical protein
MQINCLENPATVFSDIFLKLTLNSLKQLKFGREKYPYNCTPTIIISEYVIIVSRWAKDVIMLVYRPHYPMIVGFLSEHSCFNIISDSDGMDRKQIFRIKKEDYYGTFIRFQDQGHHEIT